MTKSVRKEQFPWGKSYMLWQDLALSSQMFIKEISLEQKTVVVW